MSSPIIIVISNPTDARVGAFGKLFSNVHGVACFITNGSQWKLFRSDGTLGPSLLPAERPTVAQAIFVHASDWDESISSVTQQLSKGFGRAFVFNGPGDPPQKSDSVRIVSATLPFKLMTRDAEQLVEFAANPASPLPSCCARTSTSLIALDILCQGYRATHADQTLPGIDALSPDRLKKLAQRAPTTSAPDWWKANLQLAAVDQLRGRLCSEEVSPQDAAKIQSYLDSVLAVASESRGRMDPEIQLQAVRQLHEFVREALS